MMLRWFRGLVAPVLLLGGMAQAERVPPAPINLPADFRPAGYAVREAFPGLPALRPVVITSPPGDTNRLFFADQSGVVYVLTNRSAPTLSVFLDLRDQVWPYDAEAGLLGLVFHPGWRTNRQFFVFYMTYLATGDANEGVYDRLSRFVIDPANPNVALASSEQPLISQLDGGPEHNAGDLHFGPDGNLYVSLGDEGGANDSFQNTHHLDGNFFSAILRLDVDRRPGSLPPNAHPAVNPGTYAVPADNPYVGITNYIVGGTNVIWPSLDPAKVRTEFFAIGFRNPWRFGVDSLTGDIYANDVGQDQREEIDHVVSGGDYGWVWKEGFLDWPFWVPSSGLTDPLVDYPHTNTLRAITGGVLYRGRAYPELNGAWVFADVNGAIGALRPAAPEPRDIHWLAFQPGISALGIDPVTEEILIAGVFDGKIHRLIKVAEPSAVAGDEWPSPPPAKLSATALFGDLATLTPSAGLVSYDVAVPFWSDYAIKRRWFRLPNKFATFGYRTNGAWDAPVGTVWVKHFDLPINRQDPASARPLETRLLVRSSNGVYGVSYRWDADGKDATLVSAAGLDEPISVTDSGAVKTQMWHYPGRFECQLCHNANAGYALGFGSAQLNCTLAGGATNQVQRLLATGCVSGMPTTANLLPRLAAATDETCSREWRVRSYLASNCEQCHQPGGPTWAGWDARLQVPLEDTGLIYGISDLRPGGEPNYYIVLPGYVDNSSLLQRLLADPPLHMPPLATAEVNQTGVNLLASWITNDLPSYVSYASWIANYFPDPTVPEADPAADPDGDGLSNEAEYLLNQSPVDATPVWQPQMVVGAGGGVRIRYLRLANRCFTVEQLTNWSPSRWQPVDVPENAPFFGATDEWVEVPLPMTGQLGLYRISVVAP